MDLVGKYLMIWLVDAGARLFLGLADRGRRGKAHRWCVFGMASEGQESIQGVWVEIEMLQEREPGPKAKIIREWTVRPSTCLVRWDWIISIQIAGHQSKPEVGIRPRIETDR
jgi:hypothetical protein